MAAAVVAVVGGLQVANYNSLVSAANGGTPTSYSDSQSARGSANFWRCGWFFFAGAALAATGSVLTW